jgi:ribosomal protein S18 acetylase RimI-like enzyme
MNQLKDMHELACYSRLLSCIESRNLENFHDIVYFKAKLSQNIYDIIERDTERWRLSYCTKPSQFIDSPDSPFYQSNKDIMDEELDFILSSRNEEGVWNITWNWRDYEKEFAISENWWKGNLVINYVKILMAFNRIDSEELFSKSNNRKKSMKGFVIEESTDKEEDIIKNELFQYNSAKAPFTQEPPFTSINRVVKDLNGDVIAGIISKMYCWNCLYITILWVKEECRNQGYGSILLAETEEIAKKKGSKLVHLDTFDFQAKDFYVKQGYEIFGVLDDCPEGHKRYFMKKNL